MKPVFSVLPFFILSGEASYAQTDSLLCARFAKFVKCNIQTFNRLPPQEKVYLPFDNTGCFLEETICFKAYVAIASGLNAFSWNEGSNIVCDVANHSLKNELGSIVFSTFTSADISAIAIVEDVSWRQIIGGNVGSNTLLIGLKLNSNCLKNREVTGIRLTSLQGFGAPRKFYNPNSQKYILPKEKYILPEEKCILPKEKEIRRTLYWNPNVETNSEGKAKVNFCNNSTCKESTLHLETCTADGAIGSYTLESLFPCCFLFFKK